MDGSMYSEMVLDYYRNPRLKGSLEKANAKAFDVNISCGDEIGIELFIENGIIMDARFDGEGCAISQAGVSMLLESIIGKKVDEIVKLDKKFVLDLLGVQVSPMRLKCAFLGFKVLKLSVYQFIGRQVKVEEDEKG